MSDDLRMNADRVYRGEIDTSFSLSDRSTGDASYFCKDCGEVLSVPTADDRCDGGCCA